MKEGSRERINSGGEKRAFEGDLHTSVSLSLSLSQISKNRREQNLGLFGRVRYTGSRRRTKIDTSNFSPSLSAAVYSMDRNCTPQNLRLSQILSTCFAVQFAWGQVRFVMLKLPSSPSKFVTSSFSKNCIPL